SFLWIFFFYSFIFILQSAEIINLEKVSRFNLKISGTVYVLFKNGKSTYVSRRYVSKIKERLGV
ncbi:LytTR family transcriptional regulator DNA-binding domain-containing protein, partial [Ruminococcus sp.]|uniref:LytTR family transcriptional regulator DNA-binding domain-containing protein n=1 Tax=Ruminococcus sp. TaxID=41978 RepID=UPI003FD6D4B4